VAEERAEAERLAGLTAADDRPGKRRLGEEE